MASGILTPLPGVDTVPPALQRGVFSTGPPEKSCRWMLLGILPVAAGHWHVLWKNARLGVLTILGCFWWLSSVSSWSIVDMSPLSDALFRDAFCHLLDAVWLRLCSREVRTELPGVRRPRGHSVGTPPQQQALVMGRQRRARKWGVGPGLAGRLALLKTFIYSDFNLYSSQTEKTQSPCNWWINKLWFIYTKQH